MAERVGDLAAQVLGMRKVWRYGAGVEPFLEIFQAVFADAYFFGELRVQAALPVGEHEFVFFLQFVGPLDIVFQTKARTSLSPWRHGHIQPR